MYKSSKVCWLLKRNEYIYIVYPLSSYCLKAHPLNYRKFACFLYDTSYEDRWKYYVIRKKEKCYLRK